MYGPVSVVSLNLQDRGFNQDDDSRLFCVRFGANQTRGGARRTSTFSRTIFLLIRPWRRDVVGKRCHEDRCDNPSLDRVRECVRDKSEKV
jgi:hypothetical protein